MHWALEGGTQLGGSGGVHGLTFLPQENKPVEKNHTEMGRKRTKLLLKCTAVN